MSTQQGVLRALVLQGGGALGAFELGVARVLYGEEGYRPDLIAGVSIGAITASLLARPRNGNPLATLEAFWQEVAVSAPWLPEPFRPYASALGNPHFFMPRMDVWSLPWWTNIYTTAPLRETLARLIDLEALADPDALPRLLVTATDIEKGQITPFYSAEGGLTLDHILASGALPPGFPMTRIGAAAYWDGGLFDNTPLGAVIDHMDPAPERAAERDIIVVNLFPNKGPVPSTMTEAAQRALNLMFANKTASDISLLKRFNAIAGLLDFIRADPRWEELAASEAFKAADQRYVEIPDPLTITRDHPADGMDASDFSPEGIAARVAEGETATRMAITERDVRTGPFARPSPKAMAADLPQSASRH